MLDLKGIYRDRRFWWVIITVFFVIILVLDRNNMLEKYKLKTRIHELEEQRDYYLGRIREDSVLLEQLKNTGYLEKYARENFLFKKEGETVYVIR